jgi:GT2 family glycosyltransferase
MITVVLVDSKKSRSFTNASLHALDLMGIPAIVVEGDTIDPFNYNRALNTGAKSVKTEYCLFANNDLIYYLDWHKELIAGMKAYNLRSASPFCPVASKQHGFTNAVEIAVGAKIKWTGKWLVGWALCLRMDLWRELKGFDERVDFWFSDNIYEWQLKQIGERHGMVTTSIVEHVGSASLKQLNGIEHQQATHAQHKKYIEATGHKITFWGW